MGRFIVGDVQGCFQTLDRLVRRLSTEADFPEIWLAGDLVNRGPDSLAVLRWAVEAEITCVLGNHDLYFLALMAGVGPQKSHTLTAALAADDRDDLAHWLRHQPILVEEGSDVMVHAGLHPDWTLEEAHRFSREIEACLQGAAWSEFLAAAFRGSQDPLVTALNCLTRIRMVYADGRPDTQYAGPPEDAPAGLFPWYERSHALSADRTLYFGHWAALGHRRLEHAVSLDGGCVWGRELIAVRTQPFQAYREPVARGDELVRPAPNRPV